MSLAQKSTHGWVMITLVIACAFASNHITRADVVHQRSGLPSIEGKITKLDDAGITIELSADRSDFIRWDFVRELDTKRSDPALAQYREISENLWRARTRLERRDTALAEPLFERLFERYRGQTNETALLVAEGLLRCRLARGAQDAAVIPALETSRLRRAVNTSASVYSLLPPVLDDRTSLCPQLPPVWVVSNGLIKLERDLATYNAGTDTVTAGLANQYLRAVRQQLQIRSNEVDRVLAANHPGVDFLKMMVDLASSDADRRESARQVALRNLDSAPAWMQAWTYYGAGISLLNESGVGQHERGLVDLAYLPARYEHDQPYLAGLALAKLADWCEDSGNAAAAGSLWNELTTYFPNHPVLSVARKPATQPEDRGTTPAEPAKESS